MVAELEGHPIKIIPSRVPIDKIILRCSKCQVIVKVFVEIPEFNDILIEVVMHRVQFAKT